jgi:hypothetical protein
VTYPPIKSGLLKTARDGVHPLKPPFEPSFEPTSSAPLRFASTPFERALNVQHVQSDAATDGATVTPSNGTRRRETEGLGYPFRTIVVFIAALALAVLWLVLRVNPTLASLLTAVVGLLAVSLVWWRTQQLAFASSQSAHVLAALGAVTSQIPVRLRASMPLAVVIGDGLSAIFDRAGEARFAHVGDGAIWIRAERIQDLPSLSVAVRQWRNGRAPDGFVLSVAPALHSDVDMLTQRLRVMRQAVADASRMLGARLPGYLAIYQRVTKDGNSPDGNSPAAAAATGDQAVGASSADLSKSTLSDAADSGTHSSGLARGVTAPLWYGVSSATRLLPQGAIPAATQQPATIGAAGPFDPIIRAAESNALENNALSADTRQATSA